MWNPGTINGRSVIMNKEAVVVFRLEGTNIYQTAQINISKADNLLKEGQQSTLTTGLQQLFACVFRLSGKLSGNFQGTIFNASISFDNCGLQNGVTNERRQVHMW